MSLLLCVSLIFAIPLTKAAPTTFTASITANGDDTIHAENGYFSASLTYSIFGDDGAHQYDDSFRFQNVTIPQGATINSAKLTFYPSINGAGNNVNLTIWGNAIDNATAPTSAATFTGLAKTTTNVYWEKIGAWTQATTVDTPSILGIVQEVVNRAGWASGNNMQFMILNNASSASAKRDAATKESGNPTALLTIVYTSGGDTTVPTYSTPATNTTIAGAGCNFTVTLNDETALANYTFGSNNTGTWVNASLVTISGASSLANATLTLNATVGNKVQWEVWFADSSNNLNNTGLQTMTLTGTWTKNYFGISNSQSSLSTWLNVSTSQINPFGVP